MKKGKVIFLLLLCIVLFTACKEYEPYKLTEIEQEENEQRQEEIILEEEPETQEQDLEELPLEKEEETFEIFNPELTYTGMYNGPLYATSEQWGDSAPVEEHFKNLDRNGINYALVFFGLEPGDDTEEDLEYLQQAVQNHPQRIIPFISPGFGSEEAKPLLTSGELAENYEEILKESQEFFGEDAIKGFGELEIYNWGIQATNNNLIPIYDLAKTNALQVMFHPAEGQAHADAIKELLETYPETTFLIHMFPEDLSTDQELYIELLKDYENIYYSIDADHMLYDGQTGLLYKYEKLSTEEAVASFIEDFDTNWERYINDAVLRYKPLVDAAPDKVMWGTEMGLEYAYDPGVFDRIVMASRKFIGEMDTENQEKLAYQNALAVFGEGMILEE